VTKKAGEIAGLFSLWEVDRVFGRPRARAAHLLLGLYGCDGRNADDVFYRAAA